ncbi:MAG: prolipoprotein diacylglyceryl transferase [Patescibacteria group bacterium]|nr:prolipoprotein diacylglyceryl transferase [Patescibacteria group bacterium]
MIPYFEIYSFNLGPVTINVWGFFIALAFLAATLLGYREAKRRGLAGESVLDLAIVILIASLIGGRIFYVFNEWGYYHDNLIEALKIWEGGLGIYGGFIGAVLAGWAYLRLKKLPFWTFADAIGFVLPLGLAIGRIGCFLIHDHLGRITALPWGIKTADGTIRHETALYEIVFGLVVFGLFVWLRNKPWFQKQTGRLILVFFVLYGLFRFFSDMLRATDLPGSDPVVWLGLHPSQFFSLGAIAIGLLALFLKRKAKQAG